LCEEGTVLIILFPYDNVVVGVLVLILGFVFHWIGQLVSVINWDFATKIGLQEKTMTPEYKVYEHAIAVADVSIGWIYGIAGIGLILGTEWGFRLAWIPGTVFIYHSLSAWFWHLNQKKMGNQITSDSLRIVWCLTNAIIGILAILMAWR
jgi:hypothetical protein